MKLKQVPALLQPTYNAWSADTCLRFGAAFAFYTLSALIPILLLVLAGMTVVLHFTGGGRISSNTSCSAAVGSSTIRSSPRRSPVA